MGRLPPGRIPIRGTDLSDVLIGEADLVPSPDREGYVRLTASVEYETVSGEEAYWFEVPESLASQLSETGNPWLLALLPLAATLGETVRTSAPVDPELVEAANDLTRIWRAWYPRLHRPSIEAPTSPPPPAREPRKVAAFYSGGVDSSHTVVRERSGGGSDPGSEIEELITVGGFDVPLSDGAALERLEARSARAAERLGKGFVPIRANLRDTESRRADWGRLAHGCAMGAVGLTLEQRYARVFIAATGGYRDPHPWGSHPLTDPLMSTSRTRFVHDGAAHTRIEKTRTIARFPAALDNLRVCFESGTDANCGTCLKCIRTRLCLEMLEVQDRCPTFSGNHVDLGLLERRHRLQTWDRRELRDLRELAREVGRDDVRRAIERLLRRTGRSEEGRGELAARVPDGLRPVFRAVRGLRRRLPFTSRA